MALLHRATLSPTKAELIAAWLPTQAWAAGLPEVAPLGGYRLDDPDGEVGMEGILLRSEDGAVVAHVPLTYRARPLEGAEAHLVGTTEHSVLGTRWVYDAEADPVWVATLTRTILDGGTNAEEYFEVDGERVTRAPGVTVLGSGGTAAEAAEAADVSVVRVLDDTVGPVPEDDAVLTGRWDGGEGVLAVVRSGASR